MSKTLTYEQMMALFAEGRNETAELRNSIAEGIKETAELRKSIAEETAKLRTNMEKGFAEGRKETAELRKSMAEGFAESRKETAELRASIARLEAVTEKTNARVDATNARLDKVIAKLDENTAKLDENTAKLDENTAKLEKTNARVDVTNARLDKAIAKLDENTAKLEKTNAKLDENNHKVGEHTNKLGGIIEHAVLPDIVDKFKEKGFEFNDVSVRVEILNEEKNGNLAEIDALLENGKDVIAVEAKTDMKIKDVNDHIKRLDVLRKLSRFKGKKIYGALATAVVRKKPVDYALKHGFYVLQRPDVMGVKILDFPKGHSAKAW
jgi:DNA repair exonuclease SbcCD ATPase subunit